jgi:hypothetical protein
MRAPIALALTALALSPQLSHSDTWIVDPSGSGDATTIQAAVDLASDGDTILVSAGTYAEQIQLDKDDLTITGASGAEATVVDSEPMAFCLQSSSEVTRTILSGLTFTGARGGYDYGGQTSFGLQLRGDVEIRDCVIRDNTCNLGSAVTGQGTLWITNTSFLGNGAFKDGYYPDPGCGVPCVNWEGRLEIDGCRFENNGGICNGVLRCTTGPISIRDSVFEENATYLWPGGMLAVGGTSCLLEGNLFVRNHGGPIFDPASGLVTLELRNNTFAANQVTGTIGDEPIPAAPGSVIRANVFTGSEIGLFLPDGGGGIVVECNDSWGNDVNWMGHDPSGQNGNFSLAPQYCNPGANDFSFAVSSPLLAQNNACGVTIGASGVGCGAVSVEPMSWGAIKSQYR